MANFIVEDDLRLACPICLAFWADRGRVRVLGTLRLHNIFQILVLIYFLFLLSRHVQTLLESLRLVAVTRSIMRLLVVHDVDVAAGGIEEIASLTVLLTGAFFVWALIFITVFR